MRSLIDICGQTGSQEKNLVCGLSRAILTSKKVCVKVWIVQFNPFKRKDVLDLVVREEELLFYPYRKRLIFLLLLLLYHGLISVYHLMSVSGFRFLLNGETK